jgi:LmbE family N-acetylglucosaminyl deacetylase
MNIAFIGAHQDDEMFCLGTLLRYRERGDRLFLICATNGDKGMSDDPSVPYVECARIRDREMRAVAGALKAEYACLNEPDEALFDTWDTRLKMIEAIRRFRLDLVFTHYTQDYNLDHVATSQLVFQATMLSQIASIQTDSPALPKVPPIYYVDPGPGYGFEATHFVGIDAVTVDEMMRIMSLHESQMALSKRVLGTDYRDRIKQRLEAAGQRVGVTYAEAFRPCLASRRTPLANLLP